MQKAELLRLLDGTHQQMLDCLRQVDPEAVIYDESGWRVKDIVAHVATWDAETLRSFHEWRRGSSYTIPNYAGADDFNAFAAHVRMDEPFASILVEWEATRSWLKIILNAMSEADFDAEMTYPAGETGTARVLVGEIAEHEALHLEHIRSRLGLA